MERIRSWYYARHKAVRILIQIAALIAVVVLMKIFCGARLLRGRTRVAAMDRRVLRVSGKVQRAF